MSARQFKSSPEERLAMRVHRFPEQLNRARTRLRHLCQEARRFGFHDMVEKIGMNAPALRKIEQELKEVAERATDEHPVDPYELRIIARKIGAQAEMLEQGLAE